METWIDIARRATRDGGAASPLCAGVLALCGRLDNRAAAGRLTGPSQSLFARRAADRRDPSARQLTPERLRPGFEAQLSKTSLALAHTACAVGLAAVIGGTRRRG